MNIASGLSKGQVLQRLGAKGATALLTGTATGSGPIRATIARGNLLLKGWKSRPVGNAARGKFSVKLAGIPVGGPYRLRLEMEKARTEIAAFYVGDVWILAGQSNMEGVGDMTRVAKPHPLVHAFSMRREWRPATEPLHILAESPDVCHTATQVSVAEGERLRREAVKGGGVGLYFAREMVERSGGVPQALICTAHGGTSMQQWDPARKNLGGESLYGSMLLSVRATGQPVAGVLWYQGESDANTTDAPAYTGRMKRLVAASRRDLRHPRLPWMIVQIARHFADPQPGEPWNHIQDQQRLLPGKIDFLEVVPAIDLPLDDCIHIGSEGFPRLATRLASAADRLVYGNKHEARGPQLRAQNFIRRVAPCIFEVDFDFVRGELQAPGEPNGFRLVAVEGTPLDLIFKVELKGRTARLHLDKVPGGAALHYGYGRTPVCNITDARGFSLPVFGPILIENSQPVALLPFITEWNLTPVIPATKTLERVAIAEVKALPTTSKSYPAQGFINEHDTWAKMTGQAFFRSRLDLSEPMKLAFLMGYDGPFRLWIDDQPVFIDKKGINPCFPDESKKIVRLAAGTHEVCVGMDLNLGRAWGFMLRLARVDVSLQRIKSGEYAKPVYLL